jgi:hypothetical protein
MRPGNYSLCLALAFFSTPLTHGAVCVWTNLSGGNWNLETNWDPNDVPGPGDTAVLTNAGVYWVTNDQPKSLAVLALGSSISGAQTLVVPAGADLAISGGSTIYGNSAGGGGKLELASAWLNCTGNTLRKS